MRIQQLGLFLTRRCNFNCVYCCVSTGPDLPEKLRRDELRDVIDQARRLGARALLIAGEGEPLLDEEFFPLVEYARARGLRPRVATNMAAISSAGARHLFDNNVQILGKLNSLDPRKQDYFAGRQNAHRWVKRRLDGEDVFIPEGLASLLDAGYESISARRKMLVLETVITRHNLQDIRELALFCRKHALGFYAESLLPPRDRARFLELRATPEQEKALYRAVAASMGWRYRLYGRMRCSFETNPFIDACGNMRFCFGKECSAGNIRTQSLAELQRRQIRLKNSRGAPSWPIRCRSGFRMCRTRRLWEQSRAQAGTSS